MSLARSRLRTLRAGAVITALIVAGTITAVHHANAGTGHSLPAAPNSSAGAAPSAPVHNAALGGYIDYQFQGKHHRHTGGSFSIPSAYYARNGRTEEFGLRARSSNRMEHDTNFHYKTGVTQFQGDLQMFPGISQQSVVQIFGGGRGGPILMLKGYGRKNGSLVVTRDTSRNLLMNCFGRGKIRVRIVHEVRAHRLTLYLNGVQKWTGRDAGPSYPGAYNIKYGLYGSFRAPTHTVWSDVTIS